MKRITVELSEELEAQLKVQAAELGMTPSELAAEAIEEHLGARRPRDPGGRADWTGREHITDQIEETLGGPPIR